MTASELRALTTDDGGYEGGFTTADQGSHFVIRSDDERVTVDFHVQLSAPMAVGSVYKQLTVSEARELALALEMAARAAERNEN